MAHAADCGSLATLALPDTTIQSATEVTGGSLTPPYGHGLSGLPAFCRVTGMLHPTADSRIRFEVWLPASGWNGKLLSVGNGGFAGSLYYEQMAGNLGRGYATAGTDTGHQAEAEDASWAYKHPEKIKDFAYRGLHLTTVDAKAVVKQFYDSAAKKSFFDGCSDGGREALIEAQRFPDDFDGILAGAPANDWTHLVSSGVDVGKTLDGNPAAYISSMKLPAITKAVLAQCDAADGVKDGILNDPRTCHFDPDVLLCKGGEDSLDCLSAPQVTALRKLYSGGQYSDGRMIAPGLMPGDESSWKAWAIGSAPGMSNYTQNFFRYMVLDDPSWNGLTADVDASAKAADAKLAAVLNATDPDLSRFAAHGGKLILYHGWEDPAISPLNTIGYYGAVQKAVGAQKAAGFVHLYMVPGMEHCAGGPGPSSFGQLGIPDSGPDKYGAFTALEQWVEAGKVPGEIVTTKWSAGGKVEMTRPLCPYPQVAKWNGSGDTNVAGSFRCVAPGS